MTGHGADLYRTAPGGGPAPDSVLLPGHDVPLGRHTIVRRLLPQRPRRMVGAWCFVDHFGPGDPAGGGRMAVPPHPHTGLQTVTWLAAGEILHRDSLGSVQAVLPGQLNLMTSGRGIAHAEHSPAGPPTTMHGLQLWVALPEGARHGAARFDHYPALPVLPLPGVTVTVVVGELAGVRSPATAYTPLLGAEAVIAAGGRCTLPLDAAHEYAVLAMSGAAEVAGAALEPGSLLYLGTGRAELALASGPGARLFVLGGEPFTESLVMWWNFVARTHEEVAQARADWAAGRRFGAVAGDVGDALPAPAMPTTRLKARGRDGLSRPG
ncbi:MAG TPA: pirin family protein [Pilimelia sp.]|nr:pirin family protein [Pilimelia sp.]